MNRLHTNVYILRKLLKSETNHPSSLIQSNSSLFFLFYLTILQCHEFSQKLRTISNSSSSICSFFSECTESASDFNRFMRTYTLGLRMLVRRVAYKLLHICLIIAGFSTYQSTTHKIIVFDCLSVWFLTHNIISKTLQL